MNRRQILRRAAGHGAAWLGALLCAQSGGAIVRGPSAALLHFERLTAKGGVGGRTIELRSLDSGDEPGRCVGNTRRLIDGGTLALFGAIGRPTSLAALPLATQAKTPDIAPFTGAAALQALFNRHAFPVRASSFDETAEIVRRGTAVGIRRVAVFHQNHSYGKAGLEGVTRALKPLGLEPVGLGKVERSTVDLTIPTTLNADGRVRR